MITLAQFVDSYLTTRRALGFKLEREGRLLPDFVSFLDRAGHSEVTTEMALRWAMEPVGAAPVWHSVRLAMVRGFARWLVAFVPATEVPASDLLKPSRSRRAEPFPYTDADIAALMSAARALRSPLRAATYETLIGLLAVTGMRIGEVISLDRADIDWPDQVLTVRDSKFGKSRRVPLHPSTMGALQEYSRVRDRHISQPASPSVFLSRSGTRLHYKNVHQQWLSLVNVAGLRALSPQCRPRPHDLRHRFAVTTLLGWYRTDTNVLARLPQLSTYLGHISPESTYWYLRAAPELLALSAQKLETFQSQGGL